MLRPFDPAGHETDYEDEPFRIDLCRTADGRNVATLMPARAKRLPPEAAELYRELIRLSDALGDLQDQVEALVPQLRSEGVSWSLIGHALGYTGEAVRTRWGDS